MELNKIMPEFSFHEIHRAYVRATPEKTRAAARSLLPEEISPLVGGLLRIRHFPAWLTRSKLTGSGNSGTFLEKTFSGGGMIDLGSTEDEILFGMIGQFWRPTGGKNVELKDREAFLAFSDPAYAKVAANILVRQGKGGTLLSTETRIWTPNDQIRRKFGFYWFIISSGSGWIRRLWLNAIKRKAERSA